MGRGASRERAHVGRLRFRGAVGGGPLRLASRARQRDAIGGGSDDVQSGCELVRR
jgi:hypothetical protein